jgi:flagellar basal body-associated protein FliL
MIQPATVPNPTPRDVVAPPQGEKKGIGLWVKILGLVIILAIGAGIAYYLLANKPA